MIRVTVLLDGHPLRHTFVSHTPPFGDPTYALTDGDGLAEIEAIGRRSKGDIVVHAQNLAVRMLDGANPAVGELSLRFRNKGDGSTLDVTEADGDYFAHFQIMDRCYDVYETVFRHVPPFNSPRRRAFPYGGGNEPPDEHKRNPRVDCRYPEVLAPGKLPWVQPQSLLSGVPLMHIKPQRADARLFGTSKRRATTIPHEYAHALHFATLSRFDRWELAARYGLWIAKELANGRSATHRTTKTTSNLIAFVEAIGIFSQRFYFFAKEVRPDLTGAPLRHEFVDDELSANPSLASVLPGYTPIGVRRPDGTVKARLTGPRIEGAVYGAIFLDLALRIGLDRCVNMYLMCGGFDFDAFARHARRRRGGAYRRDVDIVTSSWRM